MLIAGSAGGGGYGLLGGGEPLLVMPPEIAQTFARGGCTKAQAKTLIWERAVFPVDRLSPAIRKHHATLRVATDGGGADDPVTIAASSFSLSRCVMRWVWTFTDPVTSGKNVSCIHAFIETGKPLDLEGLRSYEA